MKAGAYTSGALGTAAGNVKATKITATMDSRRLRPATDRVPPMRLSKAFKHQAPIKPAMPMASHAVGYAA